MFFSDFKSMSCPMIRYAIMNIDSLKYTEIGNAIANTKNIPEIIILYRSFFNFFVILYTKFINQ